MTPGQIEDTATKIWCEWERLDEDANAAFVHAFIRRGKTDPFAWDRAADGATRLLREGVDRLLREDERAQTILNWSAAQIENRRDGESSRPRDKRGAGKTKDIKHTRDLRLAALTAYLCDEFSVSVADAWTVVADAAGVDAKTVQRAWRDHRSEGKARVEAVRAAGSRFSAAN